MAASEVKGNEPEIQTEEVKHNDSNKHECNAEFRIESSVNNGSAMTGMERGGSIM